MRGLSSWSAAKALVGLCLVAAGDNPAFAQSKITKIRVWTNAFIPRDIARPDGSSMTSTIAGTGPYAGKSVIRGPFPGISDCFLTDQRSFSNDPAASSRLHHEVTIDVAAGSFVDAKRCNASIEVTCDTGVEKCNHAAATDNIKLQNFQTTANPDGGKSFKFQLLGAASNGCFLGAPDIDWDLSVTLTLAPGQELLTASVDGKLDKFPAFEMYVAANGEPAVAFFQKPPPPGNTPLDLPFGASEPIKGTVQIGSLFNGIWKTQNPDRRFDLTIAGSSVQWLERRPSGATLTRTSTIAPVAPDSSTFLVERPNDDAVLQFLEFPAAFLRQEILGAHPQPSFLLLTRKDDTIRGEWHGLLVRKKPNGHLDSIVQPKDVQPKIFEFKR